MWLQRLCTAPSVVVRTDGRTPCGAGWPSVTFTQKWVGVVLEPGAENLHSAPVSPATHSAVPLWVAANALMAERRKREQPTHLPGQRQGSNPASWLLGQSPAPWARGGASSLGTVWRNVPEASVTQQSKGLCSTSPVLLPGTAAPGLLGRGPGQALAAVGRLKRSRRTYSPRDPAGHSPDPAPRPQWGRAGGREGMTF